MYSYHNHTRWSDGQATSLAMLKAAQKRGLREFGFSDHLVVDPRHRAFSWAMPTASLATYVREIKALGRHAGTLIVRLGAEVDFIPETIRETAGLLAQHPFDYIIGSVHLLGTFSVDNQAATWEVLSPRERDSRWRAYWRNIAALADSRVFDIVGHLDLPKKFGFRPEADLSAVEDRALDAIARAGMAIEINTAGWSLPAQEAYPSLRLLVAARDRDIPIVISADAHHPRHVARHFRRASLLARKAGYRQTVRFERRHAHAVPLDPG